jgi:hypothetical protein
LRTRNIAILQYCNITFKTIQHTNTTFPPSLSVKNTISKFQPKIHLEKSIELILGDKRKMSVYFEGLPSGSIVTETFDPEQENPIELQQTGWEMILDNFKKYVEQQ